ncbi:hypothetical protein BDV18DRAFT_48478 [Aspergillus unguis]
MPVVSSVIVTQLPSPVQSNPSTRRCNINRKQDKEKRKEKEKEKKKCLRLVFIQARCEPWAAQVERAKFPSSCQLPWGQKRKANEAPQNTEVYTNANCFVGLGSDPKHDPDAERTKCTPISRQKYKHIAKLSDNHEKKLVGNIYPGGGKALEAVLCMYMANSG